MVRVFHRRKSSSSHSKNKSDKLNDSSIEKTRPTATKADNYTMEAPPGGDPPAPSQRKQPSDMDLMKEKFAKLLLGEDMSGGGKGVSSALALSNAITNLAASVFGEQKRLEPMPPERKARWRKEVDWLLSVTDYIVELVPSQQQAPDGSFFEDCLDNFKDQSEFTYVDFKDANEAEKATGKRDNDKWWIPTVRIPPGGLSDETKRWLQHQKDAVNQVLKAAMAINAQVLSEMEIPESYIESLPKNGRSSLGDMIYKSITDEFFDPDSLLSSTDLSSEHKVLDLKNRIEASIIIWKRKMVQKDSKSSWSTSVRIEKRELFEERAETMLLILKHHFPGLPQSTLDISKIQYNKDVGHAVLESYSRVLESLAAAILNRVDDVIYADSKATKKAIEESNGKVSPSQFDMEKPGSHTLLDFMGWNMDQGDETKNQGDSDEYSNEQENEQVPTKAPPETKRVSYLERLEQWGGLKSPIDRN